MNRYNSQSIMFNNVSNFADFNKQKLNRVKHEIPTINFNISTDTIT